MREIPEVLPKDKENAELLSKVHPSEHVNPKPASRYNLVVIGAGTAGLVSAAGAAGLGARVALVERHLLGGDCLNVGCVPSKSIIRSSRVQGELMEAEKLGYRIPADIEADFGAVMERMRRVRARISHNDSVERFTGLGVDVFLGQGSFTGRDSVEVDGATLRFRKAVIATGARAGTPPIPGLEEAGFLTNESVFSLTEKPRTLAVIGAGPIGCEMAQAFRRLGSEVTLFNTADHVLAREDADAAAIVQQSFIRDGIRLVLGCRIKRVEKKGHWKALTFEAHGREEELAVDEILVGAGRVPNVDGLNLEAAGVDHERKGVVVNDYLQTTNPRIYAAGDICMDHKFTHTADAAARIVIQNSLFMGRRKLTSLTVPWTTYTDPEIAHVGLYERDAEKVGIPVETYVRHFSDVDRAIADGEEEGFVKIHTRKGTDKILGATIVARHAGEMISEITLAIVGGIGLGRISGVIHPYPTQAEAIRQIGDTYMRTKLTPFVRGLLGRWLAWTR
jgi:pyruvate/2-oxoglutarate dehydrogenase complex dihydrolipoamide dehydrogenase (E3) component